MRAPRGACQDGGAFVSSLCRHVRRTQLRRARDKCRGPLDVSRNGARIVDLEAIERNGRTTYAAVMIRNAGDDARAWWWYVGLGFSELAATLADTDARILDLERLSNGTYAAVLVRPRGER